MGKHFWDYEDGKFAHTISDNMAIPRGICLPSRSHDILLPDKSSGY